MTARSIQVWKLVAAVILWSYSMAPGRCQVKMTKWFVEEFSGQSLEQWDITTNGGRYSSVDGVLHLVGIGTGFPVLIARTSPFPLSDDWTISFGYRYTKLGNYGAGIQCGRGNDKDLAIMLHQDRNGQFLALNMRPVWRVPFDRKWHVVSVVKKVDTFTAYVDGKQVGQENAGSSPTLLRIGGSLQQNPWDWNDLDVKFIRVDPGERVLDLAFLSTLKADADRSAIIGANPNHADIRAVAPIASDRTKTSRDVGISAIFGLDTRTTAPALPTEDGKLVVTAFDSSVSVKPRTSVVFAPSLDRPDFEPDQVHLYVNETLAETKNAVLGRPLPLFVVDAPSGVPAVKRVRIVAEDGFKKTTEALRCNLRGDGAEAGGKAVFVLKDERVFLSLPKGEAPKATHVFLETSYLGRIAADAQKFSLDARRLPAGQYRCWAIVQAVDGTLQAPCASTVEIEPRYHIIGSALHGIVEVEKENLSVPIRFVREPHTSVARSLVYVAGNYVGESSQAEFEMQIPLADVPSGVVPVEVVGVGKDGRFYPPESADVKVQNYALNAVAAANQKRRELQTLTVRIGEVDREIEAWYIRALLEPDFRTYTTSITNSSIMASDHFALVASVGYIDSITVPGRTAEYLGYCRAAILKRAQIRLEIGKLQKQLGSPEVARATFQQVIREAGESTGVGGIAVQELRELR